MGRILVPAHVLLIVLLALGCSGHSGGLDPVTPDLTARTVSASAPSSHVIWGLYDITINPTGNNTGEVEVVPLRGALFNANVQHFLSPPISPINLITFHILGTSDLSTGYAVVDVGLKHPFPGLAQYRGFDVRAIVMMGSDTTDTYDSGIVYGYPDPYGQPSTVGYLRNPDGYTRWWNPVEFTDPMALLSFKPSKMGTWPEPTCTLNPYKYYADELGNEDTIDMLDPSQRGTFSTSGAVNTRIFELQFPADPVSFSFNLAIDASWDEPDPSGEPFFEVDSFPSTAQTQEPFHIGAEQSGGSAFYHDGAYGGNIELDIAVYDWQSVFNVSGVQEEISSIYLSGDLLNSPVDVLPTASWAEGPVPEVSSVVQAEIDPSMINFTGAGDFMLLGTVVSTAPTTYQPQIEGGEMFVYPDAALSAYFMVKCTISSSVPNFDILTPDGGESWAVGTDQEITWTGGAPFSSVTIEYSKDDFTSDINLIGSDLPNTGSFEWIDIPNDVSETVKVRISSYEFPTINDMSANYFAIVESLWERIVYAADGPAAGRQIYTIDPEGVTTPEQWSSSSALFNECAKLSPCGQYIIYTAADMSFSQLHIIDVATGVDTDITPAGYQVTYGDFSNDGTKIVGAVSDSDWFLPKELATFDYDGSNINVLTSGADAWAPQYSADDSKIIYQNFGDNELYIYDIASDTTTQYTTNGTTWDDSPCFSPDGTQVGWATAYDGGGRHIYVSPITSWNPPDFAIDYTTYIRAPCFSPGGDQIVYDYGGYSGSELAIWDIATSTYEDITANSFGDYQADWGYMIPH